MKLIELRFLRGPNLYANTPCMLALVETAGEDGAWEEACMVQRTVRELQEMAGLPAPFGCVRRVGARRFRIVCGFQNEEVGEQALGLAIDFVHGERDGVLTCATSRTARLAETAARCALAPGLAAAVGQARARGIPVLRLEDGSLQFGWGCRQARAGRSDDAASLPAGDGRIPVIAITGTNGKTTTTLLVAHTARLAGHVTGVTTTEGVFIDREQVVKGDCTGYWSAMDVLTSPKVDFAVLETARGGILKRGLAFDRCDVSVVLNVSADHLGLEGVDTIEDLAAVKGVVARSAGRVTVLNAEDPHCAAMATLLAEEVEVVYFAMDPDSPVLLRHLAQGGRAVYLDDRSVVVADGNLHEELLRVEHIPFTLNGRARYNIANALAAAAALMGAGFSKLAIADGLSTFVSDGRSNPLRTNIFDVQGVTVVVDYAHNTAAYAALAEMARALTSGKLVGIVTAPGDRRDSDLEEIGATCARHFDQIVVYESQSRGRAMGATVEVIVRGARAGGGAAEIIEEWIDIDAIRRGLALCAPGDVLVFACGTSLGTLVEALRLPDPVSAERIAASIA
ncbi:MAG TPA: Mur ligase family protein [Telluria sp.]|nr:Mur ligase family protein [Telluria sp.]